MQKPNVQSHVMIGNVMLNSFSKPKITVNVAARTPIGVVFQLNRIFTRFRVSQNIILNSLVMGGK